MKKTITYLVPFLFLIASCNEETTSTEHSDHDNKSNDSTMVLDDTAIIDDMDYPKTDYTGGHPVSALIDGPDEYFLIEDFGGLDEESILNFDVIDILPYVSEYGDSSYSNEGMKVLARDGFSLVGSGLDQYTGLVNVYYDPYGRDLVTSFSVKEGKPEGNCTMYNLDGSVWIERVYKNGIWQYSGREPFSADWTFDQTTASLVINDTENGSRTGDLIEIMPAHGGNGYTWLDQIIEKATFNSVFKINGEPFNGTLMGYDHPTDYTIQQFELNFKDGLLHGDIKIYNWWGDLELHEIFEEGIYVEEVYKMDESMMDGVAKPIIYIYPEKEREVTVNLDFDGRLTHTYPKYKHGWKVTASPDGTLIDQEGKEYYALYWEGKEITTLTIPNGTILKGSETIDFLEKELPKMGLNARETNEFIIFWMPYLENNPYNLIHFASEAYTDMAALNITPQPETMIRVMMVFQPLDSEMAIQEQNLSELYKERKGFTVVEWGGRLITPSVN